MFWGPKDCYTSFNIQMEIHSSQFTSWGDKNEGAPWTRRPSRSVRWNCQVTPQDSLEIPISSTGRGTHNHPTSTQQAYGNKELGTGVSLGGAGRPHGPAWPSSSVPENPGTSCHFIRKSTVQNLWAVSKVTPMIDLKKINSIQIFAGTPRCGSPEGSRPPAAKTPAQGAWSCSEACLVGKLCRADSKVYYWEIYSLWLRVCV